MSTQAKIVGFLQYNRVTEIFLSTTRLGETLSENMCQCLDQAFEVKDGVLSVQDYDLSCFSLLKRAVIIKRERVSDHVGWQNNFVEVA